MPLETDKTKMKPLEKIPPEWHQALSVFLDREDPSGLTTEMLGGAIHQGQLDLFKKLFVRDLKLSRMDAFQRENSPLQLNEVQQRWLDEIIDKVNIAARITIKKINPFWPKKK